MAKHLHVATKVNLHYIKSAAQEDNYRFEPYMKLVRV